MSIRVYRPSVRGERRSHRWLMAGAWLFTIATIAAQIIYPLVNNEPRRLLTITTVVLAAVAVVLQGWSSYGIRYALPYLLITAMFAFSVELVGVHTGWPFGEYSYSTSAASTLGMGIGGVPWVVPLAWVMMAHPILVASRQLNRRWTAFIGGFGLMAWDIFLDPMMVAAGHWNWVHTQPALWGVPGIPISNFFGWLLSGIILMAILDAVLPSERRAQPASTMHTAAFLIWVYFSSVIGSLFFFDRPSVALVGGLLMGAIVLPYSAALWLSRV